MAAVSPVLKRCMKPLTEYAPDDECLSDLDNALERLILTTNNVVNVVKKC